MEDTGSCENCGNRTEDHLSILGYRVCGECYKLLRHDPYCFLLLVANPHTGVL